MKCTYTKDDGTKCNSFAMSGKQYCWRHSTDITEEEKREYSSKGGKSHSLLSFGEEGWGGGVPLPEMKIEKYQDLVSVLADTINNVRSGKISQKSGSTIGYLSFIMLLAMDKAKEEAKEEKIEKLKAEGKWRPEPVYGKKVYTYKDDFYLDKEGNRLIVEKDGSTFYPALKFKPEELEIKKSKPRKHRHRSVSSVSAAHKEKLQVSLKKHANDEHEKLMDDSDYHNFSNNAHAENDYAEKNADFLKTLKQDMDLNEKELIDSS